MIRHSAFLAFVLALLASSAFGQIPPGPPFDPAKHPNPIITFVESREFKAAGYEAAQKAAGIPLLSLSAEQGSRESIELAEAGLKKIDFMRRQTQVSFYPVIRQTFKLVSGGNLVLHSFRAPKAPREMLMAVMQDAMAPSKRQKISDQRLGPSPKPEEVDIRGKRGLMFEKDDSITVSWQEDGVVHTATCSVSRKALFRLLDDLL